MAATEANIVLNHGGHEPSSSGSDGKLNNLYLPPRTFMLVSSSSRLGRLATCSNDFPAAAGLTVSETQQQMQDLRLRQ